jgi:hypothetical protein
VQKVGLIKPDITLTARIIEELRDEVASLGSRLLVVFIPSKGEIEGLSDDPPYQDELAEICKMLGIEHLDLAPAFKHTWYRTYYRQGSHWNSRGHKIAAEALDEYLTKNTHVAGTGYTQ